MGEMIFHAIGIAIIIGLLCFGSQVFKSGEHNGSDDEISANYQ